MDKIKEIKKYYDGNHGEGIPDYSILGWESEEAQFVRFDALTSSLNLNNKKILDVGCGTGNLCEYLMNKDVNVQYTGVDVLQSMIECAKRKNLEADFYCVDTFKNNTFKKESFDVVFASGIFNINLGNNKEFLYEALKLFTYLSREAVAFNLLNVNSPSKEDRYFYFHPSEVLELLEKIPWEGKKIKVIDNYLPNDFTVILYK